MVELASGLYPAVPDFLGMFSVLVPVDVVGTVCTRAESKVHIAHTKMVSRKAGN